MYERKQLYHLKKRLKEPRKFIQVLLGPRQVGKTTLAQQLSEQLSIPFILVSTDTVPPSNSIWIDQQWENARIKLSTLKSKEILLIIDEIQKIQNWSEVIKKNWDLDSRNKTPIKVLLLGSSTLTIQKGLTESLAGRFEIIQLPHWTLKEMGDAFGFTPEQYVYYGSYPGAAELINDEGRWKDYILNSIIETTISKDILQLTAIQKPALLKNLFELACRYSGEILSYTKMLGQLRDAGNTTTLAHYQELLNKTWMISGIQKFSGSNVSVKSSIPKWLVFNTALSSVYSESNFVESVKQLDLWGRRIEQAVGAYLLNQARINDFELYYWRDVNEEVDFVLKKKKKIIALEVKTSRAKFHTGLQIFSEKYKTYKNILISSDSLPWQEFLEFDVVKLFE
jgi:predicted AAA+ superfamily ATPase